MPTWGYVCAATPLLLVRPQVKAMRGDASVPAMVGIAKGAFGAMSLTGLAAVLVIWLG